MRGSKPPYLRRAHTVRRAESDGAAPCRIKKSRNGADPDARGVLRRSLKGSPSESLEMQEGTRLYGAFKTKG